MADSLTIRTATLDDIETIASFNEAMARETEDKALDADTVRAGVEALMRDAARGFYLVAERGDTVVGSLMITTEWSDWRNGDFWWVQSVYVRPEARRQGVYTALYDRIKAMAAEKPSVCGVRLYVEKENAAARATYQALGMKETPYRMYEEMIG
jgi:ribosomal protein S18 acetylase RimI-like enzyme